MARKLAVTELNRMSEASFREASKLPLHIFLDNIRSGNNVGSVFRSSDAFRVGKVILSGISAKPPHRDVLKTSLGAEKSIGWEYTENPLAYLQQAKAEGWKIAVVEQIDESISLEEWKPSSKDQWILVVGNEVRGVSDEILPLADVCLELPQFGTKHSLNVSVCTGMVLWEYMRCTGLSALRG